MRADARANREALLSTAKRLFAERGVATVPLTLIAAEAGVGIGTLYRHFPTVDDLVEALILHVRDRVVEICRRRSVEMATDPAEAWSGFVIDLAELELGALMPQLLDGRSVDDLAVNVEDVRQSVLGEVNIVLGMAKEAGLCRRDVTPLHFQAGLGAFTRPLPAFVHDVVPGLRAWLTNVYLIGLRPH